MRILLTGANGFVGSHLRKRLSGRGYCVIGSSRQSPKEDAEGEWIQLDEESDFASALVGCEGLIHVAGATPANSGKAAAGYDSALRYAERLAEAIASSSLRTVIHLSSVAALGGGRAFAGRPLDDRCVAAPATDYGRSKQEAELAFSKLASPERLVVSLRLPLIYGRGAQGSWAALSRLVNSRLPLPFSLVENRRSFLGIDNLGTLIEAILKKSGQGELSGTYLAADQEVVSLREICRTLRGALGRAPRLLPVPPSLMATALRWLGREEAAAGLFGDLVIDGSRVAETFAWSPRERTLDAMVRSLNESEFSFDVT